jgi:hypothetical protein
VVAVDVVIVERVCFSNTGTVVGPSSTMTCCFLRVLGLGVGALVDAFGSRRFLRCMCHTVAENCKLIYITATMNVVNITKIV